jgi:hypothetical protein
MKRRKNEVNPEVRERRRKKGKNEGGIRERKMWKRKTET